MFLDPKIETTWQNWKEEKKDGPARTEQWRRCVHRLRHCTGQNRGKCLGFSLPASFSLSPKTKPSWEPANRRARKWSLCRLMVTPLFLATPATPTTIQTKAEKG